jgi:hypothetical protein
MPATTVEPPTAQSSTKPVRVFRLRGVSASVFENHSKNAERSSTFHKVSLQKTYKEGDEFKTTTSFGRDDLPVCLHLLHEAWAFILEAEAKRGEDETE